MADQLKAANAAEVTLLEALRTAGIVLPSVAVDREAGRRSGFYLVDLGSARPDVVVQLAVLLRLGAQGQSTKPGLETA
ncbi:hypothetical protein [Kitasatospora sp. HPMI-4]|uniref:hypothetical protein n=1 Tax=Kitasatospora sp. HPMI-4 TaxID=3448443 RepID=UPI003F1D908C